MMALVKNQQLDVSQTVRKSFAVSENAATESFRDLFRSLRFVVLCKFKRKKCLESSRRQIASVLLSELSSTGVLTFLLKKYVIEGSDSLQSICVGESCFTCLVQLAFSKSWK